jgi:RNA polymerase sigma-54 factor
VTECIVAKQRDFFELGIEHLKPMILRDVAEELGLHESTISRVTSNKYVATPRGVFELKFFFNSAIRRDDEDDIASESVKQAIKKLIETEDDRHPHSDQKLVELLAQQKIVIARRTVAKYREMAGILSSSKRKKYF